ncbi:hypothetical protein ACVW1C_002514 [Bradyrhizobium sp. USDA 4011]
MLFSKPVRTSADHSAGGPVWHELHRRLRPTNLLGTSFAEANKYGKNVEEHPLMNALPDGRSHLILINKIPLHGH